MRTAVKMKKLKKSFVNIFLLCSLCAAQLNIQISQSEALPLLKPGEPATIKCYINSKTLDKRVWYKLTTGRKLQLVATADHRYNRSVISDKFSQRYSVEFDRISNHLHLSISKTSWEDTGTYFCGVMQLNEIQFGSGTFLMVKGASMISDSVIQLPESQSMRLGNSVILSCSFHSDQCTAEHISVMWLKNSDHSASEMIDFPHSNNTTCQRTHGGQTCVYEHLIRNFSSHHAGTYYCVVISCGQILFGHGTRIINTDNKSKPLNPTVVALMLSNMVLGLATVFLVGTVCNMHRKKSAEAAHDSPEVSQTGDAVIYSTVCLTDISRSPRQATIKDSGDGVLYSSLRYCQQNSIQEFDPECQ